MYAITGIFLFVLIFCSTLLIAGGSVLMMWDLPSLLLIAGLDIAALLVSGNADDAVTGFRQLFRKSVVLTKDELLNAAEAFTLLNWCSIGGGILGFLIGLVMTLANLGDIETVGSYLAVALITVVYGVSLSIMIFIPGKIRFLKLARSM